MDLSTQTSDAAAWLASNPSKAGNKTLPERFLNAWFARAKPTLPVETTKPQAPDPRDDWRPRARAALDRMAADAPVMARQLWAIDATSEEAVYSQVVDISRRYYTAKMSVLDDERLEQLTNQVHEEYRKYIAGCTPDAAADFVSECIRRQIMLEDPCMDPSRFWED